MKPEGERIAVLETQVENLATAVRDLTAAVKDLTKKLNEARGAARLVSWLAAFLGVTTAVAIVEKWRGFVHWLGA